MTIKGKKREYIINNKFPDIRSPITVEPAIAIISMTTGAKMAMNV